MIKQPRKKKNINVGPIEEALLPDPVHPAVPLVVEETPVAAQPSTLVVHEEKIVEFVPLVTPLTIERIDVPGLEEAVLPKALEPSNEVDVSLFNKPKQARIFVSGIDNSINSSVRVFLQKLGLQTFISTSERRHSESVMEQFQTNNNEFDFAVVILSTDEVLVQKGQTAEQGMWVSHQETIFELGFLVGKLGKSKVAVFYEESDRFKRPTEFFDLLYTDFDRHGHWQKRLLGQLLSAGIIHEASLSAT